ncbi:MAG: hypothetical protein IPK19_05710 [Chloroflexi bacterium]|nr:hypothetical protein [Chloroflexota bacterium]
MTLTEFHIYYAQTYRYYAVYVLMVLLSFYFFYALFKRRRRSDAVLYLLFTALAVYTHAHGVFAIASQGLCFLVMMVLRPDWRTRRAFFTLVGVQLVLLILIAPALWQYFLRDFLATQPIASVVGAVPDSEVGMSWLQVPSIGSIARALVRFLFFEWYYLNAFTILTAVLFVFAATALYAARSGASNWREAIRELPSDIAARVRSHLAEHMLTFFWCVGMIMLPWVLSFLVMPMFFDRYVLGAAPALYLLLAVAAVGIRRIIPTKLIATGFVILLLPGLYAFYAYPDNENWRSLASYVSEHAGLDDAIVILTSDVHLRQTYEAFQWYSPHEPAVCELYEDKLDDPETLAGLSACLEGRERAWLVGLRWMGDIERLAAAGRSPDLHEFFARFQGSQWRLEADADRPSFYLLGMYIYEKE